MRHTLNHLYQRSVREHARSDMFLRRAGKRYEPISSQEFDTAVRELSAGLLRHGIRPGDRAVIISENRVEWAMADLAILGAAAIVVPLYPSLLAHQILHQLLDCSPRLIFCSCRKQLAKLQSLKGQLPEDIFIVCFESKDAEGATSLERLREEGRAGIAADGDHYDERIDRVLPDDVATILYTSGTTGEPKGVMLTHENIVYNAKAGVDAMGASMDDRCLSFLPLCHILERTGGYYAMLYAGVAIAYADAVETLARDIPRARPTVLVCVPRVLEKIDSTMTAKASGNSWRRRLVRWAKQIAVAYARRKIAGRRIGTRLRLTHALADALLFHKLRARVGGRIRLIVSGGAPLSKELCEFFHGAGLPVMEGYGLTETSPMIALNTFDSVRPGTVGRAPEGIEVKIAEDGEILTRGPCVMKGYLGKPEETAAAIRDGWFHTGDIGAIDADGYLSITDRKKELLVTSSGKNVAPQPIENTLRRDPLIAQAVVIGDDRKFLVALLSMDPVNLDAWARTQHLPADDAGRLLTSEELRERIQESVRSVNAELAPYEQIRRFDILPRELSVEEEELTPTLKLKRRNIARIHGERIERLYDQR